MTTNPMICEVCGTPWYSLDRPCAHVAAMYRDIERSKIRHAQTAVACFVLAAVLAVVVVVVAAVGGR